ncbi:MAG: TetR/AcrR family transcriptional regulator [Deltaproteobacteria bacterium]|nr:TetR/AcrR family transcriptional regulator [Candidatus Zymogenaceae bacterium]
MKRTARKNEILDTAITLFGKFGYKKTSLSDIADAAGVTPAALYRYADGKEDLYRAAAGRGLLRWQGAAFGAVETLTDPIERFTALALASFRYLARDDDFSAMLKSDPTIFPLFSGDRFETVNDASKEMIKSILADGVSQGLFRPLDLERITHLFFSIYKMFIVGSYIETDRFSDDELFSESLDVLVRGLLTETGRRRYETKSDSILYEEKEE